MAPPRGKRKATVPKAQTLYLTTAPQWRAWLRRHHRTAPEVWLRLYDKASGKPSLPYNDAVEEALCFGWIDSVVRRVRDEPGARAQRYTPRRRGSPLSAMNAARVRRLAKAKRMTPAGLAVLSPDVLRPPALVLRGDVERALRADPAAWRHYRTFPEAYRRIRIGWVEAARGRPAVFRQRLRHFVRMTAQGRQFGLVRGDDA